MTPVQIEAYSSIIKQLYVKDHFTAEKTKRILEEEHGFPHMRFVRLCHTTDQELIQIKYWPIQEASGTAQSTEKG